MEIVIFALLLGFMGLLAWGWGADTRPSEHDRIHNW
jgi:hypothetical protein